jgi:flagellar motor switch protein FliG
MIKKKNPFISTESEKFKGLWEKSEKESYKKLVHHQIDNKILYYLRRMDDYLLENLNSETKKTKTTFYVNRRTNEWMRSFTSNTPDKITTKIITIAQMDFQEKLDMLGTIEFLIVHKGSFTPE